MQNNRLFEIVYLLMDRRTITSKELAEYFEVSTRTILRDVETLSMAGVPIYTTKGKNGGISILDGYVLNKTTLSEEDQVQIIAALQGLSVTDQYTADSLLRRLGALFKRTEDHWIEVDYSRWGNSRIDREKFELLKNAIISKRAISFEYFSPIKKSAKRTVYPLKLIFKSRSWYIQGYCLLRNNYRTFRIGRIKNLELLEETFDQNQFSPPSIDEVDTDSNIKMVDLKLRFPKEAASTIYDQFEECTTVEEENGNYIVSVELPEGEWLYNYLLFLGKDMEILEPLEVRENFIKRVEEIQKKYLS